jgi:hypothetical protein
MIRKLAALVFLGLLLWPSNLKADSIYMQLNGLWGTPNCENGTEYVYAVDDVYLDIFKDEKGWRSTLSEPVQSKTVGSTLIGEFRWPDAKQQGHFLYFITYSWADGQKLMSATSAETASELSISSVPASAPANYAVVAFEKCSNLPQHMYFAHEEGIQFMQFLANAKSHCSSGNNDCMNYIFSLIDVSGKQETISC